MAVAGWLLIILVIQSCQGLPSVSVQNAGPQYASASNIPVGPKHSNQNLGAPSQAQKLLNGGIYPKYPVGFEPEFPGTNNLGLQQHIPIPVQTRGVPLPAELGNNLNNVLKPQGSQLYTGVSPQRQYPEQILQNPQNLVAPLINTVPIHPIVPVNGNNVLRNANNGRDINVNRILQKYQIGHMPSANYNTVSASANSNNNVLNLHPEYLRNLQNLNNQASLNPGLGGNNILRYINGRLEPLDENQLNLLQNKQLNSVLQEYLRGPTRSIIRPEPIFTNNPVRADPFITLEPGPVVITPQDPALVRPINSIPINNTPTLLKVNGPSAVAFAQVVNSQNGPSATAQASASSGGNNVTVVTVNDPRINVTNPINNTLSNNTLVTITDPRINIANPINNTVINNNSTLPNITRPSASTIAQVVTSQNGTTATAQASATSGGKNATVVTINGPGINITNPINNRLSNNTIVNVTDPRINITNPANNTLSNNTSPLPNVNGPSASATAQVVNSQNGTTVITEASANSGGNNTVVVSNNQNVTTFNGTTPLNVNNKTNPNNTSIGPVNVPTINITSPINNTLNNNTTPIPNNNGPSASAIAQVVNSQNGTTVITQTSTNNGGNNTVINNQNITLNNRTTPLNINNQTSQNSPPVNVPTNNITNPLSNTLINSTSSTPITNGPVATAPATNGDNNTISFIVTTSINGNQSNPNTTTIQLPGSINDPTSITNEINNILTNMIQAMNKVNGQNGNSDPNNQVSTTQSTSTVDQNTEPESSTVRIVINGGSEEVDPSQDSDNQVSTTQSTSTVDQNTEPETSTVRIVINGGSEEVDPSQDSDSE